MTKTFTAFLVIAVATLALQSSAMAWGRHGGGFGGVVFAPRVFARPYVTTHAPNIYPLYAPRPFAPRVYAPSFYGQAPYWHRPLLRPAPRMIPLVQVRRW